MGYARAIPQVLNICDAGLFYNVGKFPAQMNDGMEEAQRRAQVRGGGDRGL